MTKSGFTFEEVLKVAKKLPYFEKERLIDRLMEEETEEEFEQWLAAVKKKRKIKEYSDSEVVDIIHKVRRKNG